MVGSRRRQVSAACRWRCLLRFLRFLELHRMQARVVAVGGQQFGVRTALDDAALVHDEDLVRSLDGR